MKKLESLNSPKFKKLSSKELSQIVGGIQDGSGTDLDSFVTTASNPNEGDGMECDENCDFSGSSLSMELVQQMVGTGIVDLRTLEPGSYIGEPNGQGLIMY